MKQTAKSKGTVTSIDGKTTITVEELDRRHDDGEDLSMFFDHSKATRPGTLLKPGDTVTVREVDDATGKLIRVRRFKHGGHRPGAGRKASGKSGRTLRLGDETWAKLDARAARAGVSVGGLIERLVG